MMRQRTLHPGYFKDAKLLALSPLHRILFAGLWCCADREGKLEDNAIELKIEILPLDNCDVETMLQDFERVELIRRYEARDRRYILIPNFLGYQHPHPREMKSEIPPPEDGGSTRKRARAKNKPRTVQGHALDRPVPSGSSGSSGSSDQLPPLPPFSETEGGNEKSRAEEILNLDVERLLRHPPEKLTRRDRKVLEQLARDPDTPAERTRGPDEVAISEEIHRRVRAKWEGGS